MIFPHYHQLDTMDCGPTCLKIIAQYYGKTFSIQDLRERCHITKAGVSLLGISDAAESIGFRTIAAKVSWQQLYENVPLPCIVHWNQKHFVVVYNVRQRSKKCFVYVSDPAEGLLKYSKQQFLNSWAQTDSDIEQGCGIVLMIEPSPNFFEMVPQKSIKYNLIHIVKYLKPHKQSISQIMLAMIVASCLNIVLTFTTQSIVDVGVSTGQISFVVTMLVAQMVIIIGQLANDLIKNWLMLHVTARISISLISDFLAKMMRLPISFFDTKMTGDIMQRIQDHDRIQDFLTNALLSIVMAVVLFTVYGFILGGYNPTILLVFLFGSALYIGWILVFLRWRRKLDYMRFQESAANQNSIIQLIGGMQEIKLNNCEKQKRWDWERIQVRLFNVSLKSLTLQQAQQIGGTFIDQTKNIIISFLAASSVINGNMTLGMMVALQYILGQLNAPVSQFISFVKESQDASISMERLGEIHQKEDEENFEQQKTNMIDTESNIEFCDVTFQYDGPHSTKVIDGITLTIPSNKTTAIVGASGSGKTTMLKLMLGFYQPVSGKIMLGNTPLSQFSEREWRSKCGCVMQDGFIFSDTIAGNIGISDEYYDIERVKTAASIANINDWIEQLPLGYKTNVGCEGHGLSVGQRQRILIARAVYKDAPYLFFDEATNSLDANNEKAIMENLNFFFKNKTVVVVAHRLSTVKNADNIIVMENGKIVEQGTHEQLTLKHGKYYELVKNQLELGN
ncbi:MAG: peptidase domain-containing ABC transporter [Salinivirgaceae bacterium]|nr:peptidase domain-containing ABC transporter [Salinivirgaceae bacterium]